MDNRRLSNLTVLVVVAAVVLSAGVHPVGGSGIDQHEMSLSTTDGRVFTAHAATLKNPSDALYVFFFFVFDGVTADGTSVVYRYNETDARPHATTSTPTQPRNATCTATTTLVPFSLSWAEWCMESSGFEHASVWIDALDTCSITTGNATWTSNTTQHSDTQQGEKVSLVVSVAGLTVVVWLCSRCVSAQAKRHLRLLVQQERSEETFINIKLEEEKDRDRGLQLM